MVRLGLGAVWKCLFANDFNPKKAAAYRSNFDGAPELICDDVREITPDQLPDGCKLAWASFPCQDLSLAGLGAGLSGNRSSLFWSFWNLMLALKQERRAPPIIVLENVAGLMTSHRGRDLSNIIATMADANYRVGAIVLDAAYFVPQSRPRLFIVAFDQQFSIPKRIAGRLPNPAWHPLSLQNVVTELASNVRKSWVWWKLPMPTKESQHLSDIIEEEPTGVNWHSAQETKKLLNMMTLANLCKVHEAQRSANRQVGTVYKRTRNGTQRAEVRFDGISGCLRTPAGGSSRQIIMVIEGKRVRSRLVSPRETARLMGLHDQYVLPVGYNDAYHLTGDGVVVPVVGWLEQHIIRPLAKSTQRISTEKESIEINFV